MSDVAGRIADNLARLRERMAASAARGGRGADAVRLVAVTKGISKALIAQLVAQGCEDLGESRPQELWTKAQAITKVRWHLVGHLQRNKIRRTLGLVSLIHSLDSPRLLSALDAEAALAGRAVSALVEVNISGDAGKTGLVPDEVPALLELATSCRFVAIRGLMGMAGLEGGAAAARRDFARLRELRDQLAAGDPGRLSLPELSMGMSDDFESAIEEGATMVRIGSALVEGIQT